MQINLNILTVILQQTNLSLGENIATNLIPKAKMRSTRLVDALMIGTIKAIEERATKGFIGNGTLISDAIK